MKQKPKIKPLKDLTLLDRFLFAEAMEDPVINRMVLEIILGKELRLLAKTESEKEFRKSPQTRSIRIDVYSADEESVYDTEVQKRDPGNLPRRSRFYHGLVDSSLLVPGVIDFNELKNSYVIIISPFDILKMGYYCYTFQMRCDEIPEQRLDDGAVRIFLNTRGIVPGSASQELIELLRYFEQTTGETGVSLISDKLKEIHKRIQAIRVNKEIGVKYMQLWEEKLLDRQEAKAEGRAEGREQGQVIKLISMVRKKAAKGLSAEAIAELLEEDAELTDKIYQAIQSHPGHTDDEIYTTIG